MASNFVTTMKNSGCYSDECMSQTWKQIHEEAEINRRSRTLMESSAPTDQQMVDLNRKQSKKRKSPVQELSITVPNLAEELIQVVEAFSSQLQQCGEAIEVEMKYHEMLKSVDSAGLFAAELALLKLASYEKCTSGIFYAAILGDEADLYVRIFETGVYTGFFEHSGRQLLSNNMPNMVIHVIHAHNEWDVQAMHGRRMSERVGSASGKHDDSEIAKKRAMNQLMKSNKQSVINSLSSLDLDATGSVFRGYVAHAIGFATSQSIVVKVDGSVGNQKIWSEGLKTYILNRNVKEVSPSIHGTVAMLASAPLGHLQIADQFAVLSSIPNFHHWLREKKRGVRNKEQLCGEGLSPRNIMMKDLTQINILKCVLAEVYDGRKSVCWVARPSSSRVATKGPRIDRPVHRHETERGDEHVEVENVAVCVEQPELEPEPEQEVDLYLQFKLDLVLKGTFLWRVQSEEKDCFVICNMDARTGKILLYDFVTVTCWKQLGMKKYSCTCEMFRISCGVSCCHCRFLQEMLESISAEIKNDSPVSAIEFKLVNAKQSLSQSVVELPSPPGRKQSKFSVVVDGYVEYIHIFQSKGNKGWYISCQSSECHFKQRKKVIRETLLSPDNLCKHLLTFRNDHRITLTPAMLEEMANVEDESDEGCSDEEVEEETEDVEVCGMDESQWEECFDPKTGGWLFKPTDPRYSHPVGQDPSDEELQKQNQTRMQLVLDQLRNKDSIVELCASIPEDTTCPCEAGWLSENGEAVYMPERTRDVILYTLNGIVRVRPMSLTCKGKLCLKVWNGEGEKIFRTTQQTCAGEEIGWDFVEHVIRSKCGFKSYCDIMTARYQCMGSTVKFMSPTTFRAWFRCWASHQHREFRKACPGGNCDALACDGTAIGISPSQAKVPPIQGTGQGPILETKNRRSQRCFISHAKDAGPAVVTKVTKSKTHLRSLARRIREKNEVEIENEEEGNKLLMEYIPEMARPLLMQFIGKTLNEAQMLATANLFYQLSFDVAVTALVPRKMIPFVEEMFKCGRQQDTVGLRRAIEQSFSISKHLGEFVLPFVPTTSEPSKLLLAVCFLGYCITFVQGLELTDPAEAQEIPMSYNPPRTGIAYYFTPSGNRLRNPRTFSIDLNGKSEQPAVWSCNKYYPALTKGGRTLMFLFFCPTHGHCYGFHIVNGSEGRKDPMHALYSYSKDAPKVLFYDFACQLEEYSLNRESGFFADTSFFHDTFHGYGHKCPAVYRSSSMVGKKYNESICEQFNAFLQNLKGSAKHMNQTNFTFFSQFLIDIWNQKKQVSFAEKKAIVDKIIASS